jgi:hypothetical protein
MWLVESCCDGLSGVILVYSKTAFELHKLYRLIREEVTKLILRELSYINISHIRPVCGVNAHSNVHNNESICTKLNSVVLVRKRTIPTERPQPVGEVSANVS